MQPDTDMQAVLAEIRTNGAACSRDVAEACGMTVKKVGTYLMRLGKYGLLRKGALQYNETGRPSRIWWPQ